MPFELPSTTYIKHVLHAWRMVDPWTGLVAGILPNTLRNSPKNVENFWRLVHCAGASEPLDSGSFKESGTNVETVIFFIDKESVRIDSRPYNGYPNVGIWHLIAIIENNDADTAREAKKLAYQNTAQSRKKLLELVQKVAKEYIEANGIACLNEGDYEYVVNDLVEGQERIKEYEREQEEKRNKEFMSDWEDTPTTTAPEPTMEEKIQALQRLYKINKNPEIKDYIDAFKRLIKLKI